MRGAGAGVGAALLSRIARIQQSFADEASATIPSDATEVSRSAYSLDPEVTYLNHASIGTIPRVVQQAHHRYLDLCEENPWLYMWGGAWEAPREAVRAKAAALIGVEPGDIAFVHNTTETFNLLAQGLPLGPGDEALFPSLNHPGASVCFEHHAATRGYSVRRFPLPADVARDPRAILERYADALSEATKVLVLPHVDNVLGARHPVARISALARAHGVRFIAVDAAQTIGMVPVDVSKLGVDVYATSPHKWLQAPKGLGMTFLSASVREALRPMWVTWGQARWQGSVRRFEDYGTRNLAAVLTLGDAIDFQRRLQDDTRQAYHRMLRRHAHEVVARTANLTWRSPDRFEDGSALYTLDVDGRKAGDISRGLFAQHGIVLRPFETDELNGLRVSPNIANSRHDLDRLFAAIESLTHT